MTFNISCSNIPAIVIRDGDCYRDLVLFSSCSSYFLRARFKSQYFNLCSGFVLKLLEFYDQSIVKVSGVNFKEDVEQWNCFLLPVLEHSEGNVFPLNSEIGIFCFEVSSSALFPNFSIFAEMSQQESALPHRKFWWRFDNFFIVSSRKKLGSRASFENVTILSFSKSFFPKTWVFNWSEICMSASKKCLL